MLKIEVFDPPMCCNTGICGNSVDPTLVTFASDLEWLKKQGVEVRRYGLSFEPARFVENETVKNAICKSGNACLPLIIAEDKIASRSIYPSRAKLAEICKIKFNDDAAPPIHREENCCCGEDCDCGSVKLPEGTCTPGRCDCSNAPAEENCSCTQEGDFFAPYESKKPKIVVLLIILLIMAVLIALRFLL